MRLQWIAVVFMLLHPNLLLGQGDQRPTRRIKQESSLFVGGSKTRLSGKRSARSKRKPDSREVTQKVQGESTMIEARGVANQARRIGAAAPTRRPSRRYTRATYVTVSIPHDTAESPSLQPEKFSLEQNPAVAVMVASWLAEASTAPPSTAAVPADMTTRSPTQPTPAFSPSASMKRSASPTRLQAKASSWLQNPAVSALVDSWIPNPGILDGRTKNLRSSKGKGGLKKAAKGKASKSSKSRSTESPTVAPLLTGQPSPLLSQLPTSGPSLAATTPPSASTFMTATPTLSTTTIPVDSPSGQPISTPTTLSSSKGKGKRKSGSSAAKTPIPTGQSKSGPRKGSKSSKLNVSTSSPTTSPFRQDESFIPTVTPTQTPMQSVSTQPVSIAPVLSLLPVSSAPTLPMQPVSIAPTLPMQPASNAPTISLLPVSSAPTLPMQPASIAPTLPMQPASNAPTIPMQPTSNAPTSAPRTVTPTAPPIPVATVAPSTAVTVAPNTQAPTPTSGSVVPASPFGATFAPTPGSVTAEHFEQVRELTCAHIEDYLTRVFALSPFILLEGVQCTALATTTSPSKIFFDLSANFDDDSDFIPSQADIDRLVTVALQTPEVDDLIAELNALPASHPFSSTTSIEYELSPDPRLHTRHESPSTSPVAKVNTPNPSTATPSSFPTKKPTIFPTGTPTRPPSAPPSAFPVGTPSASLNSDPRSPEGTTVPVSPFTVTYVGSEGSLSLFELGEVASMTCSHIEDHLASLFDMGSRFIVLNKVSCAAMDADISSPNTRMVYATSATFSTESIILPSETDLGQIIADTLISGSGEDLIAALNNLPSSNPFSRTSRVEYRRLDSAGHDAAAGPRGGLRVSFMAFAVLVLYAIAKCGIEARRILQRRCCQRYAMSNLLVDDDEDILFPLDLLERTYPKMPGYGSKYSEFECST